MALAHIIMTGLLDKNQTGYELAKSFDTSLGFFWQASHQQIYSELRKLEQKGWLTSEQVLQQGKPNKVVYELTDKGQIELENWVDASTKKSTTKDELLAKLYNLNDKNVGSLIRAITERRDNMLKSQALYEKIRSRNYPDPKKLPINKLGVYLALKSGIENVEIGICWCNEALVLLANIEERA